MNKLPTRMTFFYQLHPVVSAVYFFEAILSLLLFNHLATALTGYVGLLLVGIFYTGQSAVWRQFKWNLSLLLMIVFFNVLLNQRFGPVLYQFSVGDVSFKLTLPALLYGVVMGLMLVEMLMAFAVLNVILPAPKLVYVLSPVTPKLGLLVVISMNLVKTFSHTLASLAMLQQTRNVQANAGGLLSRIRNAGRLLRILLEDALASGMETARLMDARGFGVGKRTHYWAYHWKASDWAFLSASILIFVWAVVSRIQSAGWSTSVGEFTRGWMSQDLVALSGLGGLLLLPLAAEGVYRAWTN
ncbi:energy-coupling factor transporter transmembrane component T [Lentilactobacillus buchneri]|uniref:ABC-type cobalt transport system, permease component CbiQ related transporter n=3 Tax=Lentilactobacillus buchneri TaxID=1581 RepID=J9W1B4_LENBU|nr:MULTISPECIES: energy-coupling factor transporter transmembrane component T [Lentilactobacillus]MCC6100961.1 energy-coupling factor transporter transmembrane protein EcfT [Lactobacillus sp.]AFR99476.1 ABC-type cobalt transport system, permease component CbiQ related transporter [Lentilactobacillus buchneri subsp. silagei CD034]BEJ53056.1 ABC transporter permease [Lentilactobacillus buchneri subsp. silagei]GED91314.1 cobalt ABC transporter permease protein [Lentilactobacillus buchneri subsp. s